MTTAEENKKLLEDSLPKIQAAIEKARFKPCVAPVGCNAYEANEDGWQILAVAFMHHEERGFDGAATDTARLLVVHLTPELAKQAVELAEKQVMS